MQKIIYDYEFNAETHVITIEYGRPSISANGISIDVIDLCGIEIRNGRNNTLDQFVVNYLEKICPNTLVVSLKDYALSVGLNPVPVESLSKLWKRNFRRKKITNFFGRIVNSNLYRRIFHRKKYWKEVRDKRIDYYFSNPILTGGYQTTWNPNINYEKK